VGRLLQLQLHWQVLIALAVAVITGLLLSYIGGETAKAIILGLGFVGTLFLNALKMLIVPLVMAAIITGISGIGERTAIGRIGGKTILYYLTTSLIAILIGLALVNIIEPGIVDGRLAKDVIKLADDGGAIIKHAETRKASDIFNLFLDMVPVNIVKAAANGQMLGLIFFSLLFGFFMMRIPQPYSETMKNFWQGIFEVMMRITELVMKFTPIGVFALLAKVVATSGLGIFRPLFWFVLTVLAALAIHFFIVLPLILRFVARVRPSLHYRAMTPAILMAFSTSSSAATLPLTMDCVEKNAGVSNRTTSFVLPLGATINMDGTALFEGVAVIFIAQAYGADLSFATQFIIVFTALLTSIGVAAVPQASLVAIVVILKSVGIAEEGILLILAVDRILDMCRTSVNVFSDSCGAVVIGRSEGEETILQNPDPSSPAKLSP